MEETTKLSKDFLNNIIRYGILYKLYFRGEKEYNTIKDASTLSQLLIDLAFYLRCWGDVQEIKVTMDIHDYFECSSTEYTVLVISLDDNKKIKIDYSFENAKPIVEATLDGLYPEYIQKLLQMAIFGEE